MLQSKFLRTVLLATIIVGGIWALANRDKIQNPSDVVALIQQQVSSWIPETAAPGSDETPGGPGSSSIYLDQPAGSTSGNSQFASHSQRQTPLTTGRTIQGVLRIGSWRVQPDVAQIPSAEPLDLVAELCRQYDIMVIQQLDRLETSWVRNVVDRMNQMGAAGSSHLPALSNGNRADYIAISDFQKREGSTQTVILYNRQTVLLDQAHWYLVDDQAGFFQHDPMVAWFRARGVAPERAFTFSLAAISINPDRPDLELEQLGTLIRAIRSDGRDEDDVILVGDFQSDDRGLEAIQNQGGYQWSVHRQSTSVGQHRQYDNVLFSQPATSEFTGRGGVVDFPARFQLAISDALAVSPRLPVWAEFSVFEAGQGGSQIPGRVAEQTQLLNR